MRKGGHNLAKSQGEGEGEIPLQIRYITLLLTITSFLQYYIYFKIQPYIDVLRVTPHAVVSTLVLANTFRRQAFLPRQATLGPRGQHSLTIQERVINHAIL